MNRLVLKTAEKQFLTRYPGGFENPEMVEIGKKHKLPKLHELAKESLSKGKFEDPLEALASFQTLVSRSSMVSMYEKPKLRDTLRELGRLPSIKLAAALYETLHGKKAKGFERFVELLAEHKLAKWTLATVALAYLRPTKEVFVKPSTAKLVNERLELGLLYKPRPSWEFYRGYRKALGELKTEVDSSLAPNNPAFTGFLMMTLGGKL